MKIRSSRSRKTPTCSSGWHRRPGRWQWSNPMHIPTYALPITLALAILAGPALAQSGPAQLPEWDQLSSDQREALIATVRDRWNEAPDRRARMLRHAERWQQMSPEERERAHHG